MIPLNMMSSIKSRGGVRCIRSISVGKFYGETMLLFQDRFPVLLFLTNLWGRCLQNLQFWTGSWVGQHELFAFVLSKSHCYVMICDTICIENNHWSTAKFGISSKLRAITFTRGLPLYSQFSSARWGLAPFGAFHGLPWINRRWYGLA